MKAWMMFILLTGVMLMQTGCFGSVDKNMSAPSKTVEGNTDGVNTSSTQKLSVEYQNISPKEAKKRLESETGIVLLDVRTPEEYEEYHIPGSLLIPVDVIETEAPLKLQDKKAPIFVYCRSGRRSVTASEALVRIGYAQVYNLGGILDWPYETEKGAPNDR